MMCPRSPGDGSDRSKTRTRRGHDAIPFKPVRKLSPTSNGDLSEQKCMTKSFAKNLVVYLDRIDISADVSEEGPAEYQGRMMGTTIPTTAIGRPRNQDTHVKMTTGQQGCKKNQSLELSDLGERNDFSRKVHTAYPTSPPCHVASRSHASPRKADMNSKWGSHGATVKRRLKSPTKENQSQSPTRHQKSRKRRSSSSSGGTSFSVSLETIDEFRSTKFVNNPEKRRHFERVKSNPSFFSSTSDKTPKCVRRSSDPGFALEPAPRNSATALYSAMAKVGDKEAYTTHLQESVAKALLVAENLSTLAEVHRER